MLARRPLSLALQILHQALPARWSSWWLRRRPPRFANLEVTTECNLRCPLCPTHLVPRESRFLAVEQALDVLNSSAGALREVNFHIQGEPLVHPRLFEIVGHFHRRGVKTWIATNGQFIERHLDALFESGLHGISIDIDGADRQDYEKYRHGGEFDRVVRGVRRLTQEKRSRGSQTPIVKLQAIRFPYNVAREAELRSLLEGLGADDVRFKRPSYFHDFERGLELGIELDEAELKRSQEASAEFLELVREGRETFGEERERPEGGRRFYRDRKICPQLKSASVLSDGRVVACCMDAIGSTTYGHLADQSFADIWSGKSHAELIERFARRELPICQFCTLG